MGSSRKPGASRLPSVPSLDRPGEGSRIRLNDIDTDARMFVIRNAKAGKDIHLPITPEIAFAISLAVNAEAKPHHEVKETDLVFPGCRQISQRAELPIRGQALRHSYSTVAVDLKIDDLIRHFLMGHAPKGISQDYVALLILQNGPAMREAQEQISNASSNCSGSPRGLSAKRLPPVRPRRRWQGRRGC
jgi:integrase